MVTAFEKPSIRPKEHLSPWPRLSICHKTPTTIQLYALQTLCRNTAVSHFASKPPPAKKRWTRRSRTSTVRAEALIVPGTDCLPGDEDIIEGLEARVNSFNVAQWWEETRAVQLNRKAKAEPADSTKLHNPYAGVPYAWQLTETLSDFLNRLPPETTEGTADVPWIFICNPFIPRKSRFLAQNQFSRGNEDEAPEEDGSQLNTLIEGGTERLRILGNFVDGIHRTKKSATAKLSEINHEKKQAVKDVLSLAHACKVRSGKWLLFCSPRDVNEVWAIIARATANNELGIAAKVAPRQDATGRKDRMIAVYTADFNDVTDVMRVLRRLRELKVVEAMGRPIYYKPDAFTYIGVAHGNQWDIRASIHSSLDIMPKQ